MLETTNVAKKVLESAYTDDVLAGNRVTQRVPLAGYTLLPHYDAAKSKPAKLFLRLVSNNNVQIRCNIISPVGLMPNSI